MKVYQDSLVFVDKKIRIPVCDFAFEVITVGSKEFRVRVLSQTSSGSPVPDQSKTGKETAPKQKKRGRKNSTDELTNNRRSSRLRSDPSCSSGTDVLKKSISSNEAGKNFPLGSDPNTISANVAE
jgi:hypothetical protein